MRYIAYIFLFSVLFQFCSSTITNDELKEYIHNPKNGLNKEVQFGDDKIGLMFIPSELLISRDLKRFSIINQEIIDSLSQLYNEKLFFQISFSHKETDLLQKLILDKQARTDLISYFSYDIANDIKIFSNSDTINCSTSIYIPIYELSKSNTILLVYKKENIRNSKEFIVRFNGYKLGYKNIGFNFKQKDIKKIPKVKFY